MIEENIPVSVLIVDDNPAKLTALAAALAGMDIEVITAPSGTEALHKLLAQDFAAVLLDVNMPVMDGFETASTIRLRQKSEHLPILFITAERLSDDARMQGYALGAVDYILSPVPPQILRSKVAVFADLYRLREQIARQNLVIADHNRMLEEKIVARTIELRESEARYKRITEGLTDYLYTVRIENGRTVETTQSPACVTVTGYTAEEFAANPNLWLEMVVPEDRELVIKHAQQTLAVKDGTPIAYRITRKDGEIRWVSDKTILFKDANGKLLSYDGVIRDITVRKQAEAQLKNSKERHRQIIQTSMDGFWIINTEGRILDVNDAYCQMSGYAREELLNMRIPDVEAKETPEETAQHIQEVITKGYGRFETRHRRKDGQLLNIEASVVHRPGMEGECFFVFLRDITARKQAEAQINEQLNELRRWYEATVEREMRTLDLKREINELLAQAGQPPRYLSVVSDEPGKSS